MQTLLEYLGSDVTSMRSSGKPKKNLKDIHVGRSYNDAVNGPVRQLSMTCYVASNAIHRF